MNQISIKKKVSVTAIGALLMLAGCTESVDKNVLAQVNGASLTRDDLDAYLVVKNIPADQEKLVDKAFQQLLEREIQSTKIENMDSTDNSTIDMEVAEFKRQLLISRYFEKFIKDKVNENAVRNYYASNADKYTLHQARVSHILVRTNSTMSENETQARQTKINEAYSKIILGESFETAVAKYSEDKLSVAKNGDLGWVKKGGIDPKFSELVFKMKADELSKPFKTAYGYHIVKIIEESRKVIQPFDAVKGNIRYQLRNEAKAAEIERLRKESDVTIHYGNES
jgi:peptidyl-prolyl cis-trans isomerase C